MIGPLQADVFGQNPAPLGEATQDTVPARQAAARPRAFFVRLGRDYVYLASPSNVLVLGAGGLTALGAHPFDLEKAFPEPERRFRR